MLCPASTILSPRHRASQHLRMPFINAGLPSYLSDPLNHSLRFGDLAEFPEWGPSHGLDKRRDHRRGKFRMVRTFWEHSFLSGSKIEATLHASGAGYGLNPPPKNCLFTWVTCQFSTARRSLCSLNPLVSFLGFFTHAPPKQ